MKHSQILNLLVIPAKAGIQIVLLRRCRAALDARFHGHDKKGVR